MQLLSGFAIATLSALAAEVWPRLDHYTTPVWARDYRYSLGLILVAMATMLAPDAWGVALSFSLGWAMLLDLRYLRVALPVQALLIVTALGSAHGQGDHLFLGALLSGAYLVYVVFVWSRRRIALGLGDTSIIACAGLSVGLVATGAVALSGYLIAALAPRSEKTRPFVFYLGAALLISMILLRLLALSPLLA